MSGLCFPTTLSLSSLTRISLSAGHSGEVFACRFDPAGQLIASGSMDRSISELTLGPTSLLLTYTPPPPLSSFCTSYPSRPYGTDGEKNHSWPNLMSSEWTLVIRPKQLIGQLKKNSKLSPIACSSPITCKLILDLAGGADEAR